jgi:putative transcriptional regulator
MSEMFELLKEGLEGIIQHQKGKKKLKKRVVEAPEPAIQYNADDVKRIRKSLHYSQDYFALFLNISKKTVQAWESGRRNPNHAALRLLEIIDKGYYRPQYQRKRA